MLTLFRRQTRALQLHQSRRCQKTIQTRTKKEQTMSKSMQENWEHRTGNSQPYNVNAISKKDQDLPPSDIAYILTLLIANVIWKCLQDLFQSQSEIVSKLSEECILVKITHFNKICTSDILRQVQSHNLYQNVDDLVYKINNVAIVLILHASSNESE